MAATLLTPAEETLYGPRHDEMHQLFVDYGRNRPKVVHARLTQLLDEALSEPNTPAEHRARYNTFRAQTVDDPVPFIAAAEQAVVDMQKLATAAIASGALTEKAASRSILLAQAFIATLTVRDINPVSGAVGEDFLKDDPVESSQEFSVDDRATTDSGDTTAAADDEDTIALPAVVDQSLSD